MKYPIMRIPYLKVLHAKDEHSIAEMVENLNRLMGLGMTDETREAIGEELVEEDKCKK